MPTASKEVTIVVNGTPVGVQLSETADGGGNREITLPVGYSVTDWVKTDGDTAAGNVSAGHALVDGLADVYWTGGCRYGVTIDVTTNAIALDGGAGDDFPASASVDVVVSQQVQVDFPVDGDDLKAIVVTCDQECHFDFQESDNTSIYQDTLAADAEWDWFLSSGVANELTGDATGHIMVSNASATDEATFVVAFVYDSTT